MDPYSYPDASVPPPPPQVPPVAPRWWRRPWVVVVTLVVLPPVGIALVWTSAWSRKGKVVATALSVIWCALLLLKGPPEEAKGGGEAKGGNGRPEAPASPSSAEATATGTPSTSPPTPAEPPQLLGKVLKEAQEVADGAGYDVVTHDASDRDDGQWDADGWKVCFQVAGGQRGGGRPVLDLGVVRVDSPCPAADGEKVSWPSMPGVAGATFVRAGEMLEAVGVRKVRPESVYTDVTLPADPSTWRVCFQDPAPGKEIENPQYATAYLKLAPPDAACPAEPYARLRPEPTS